ncbi:hypothetical protein EON66_03410 [archaeon]|nr:MAG: hypothetical protein EON66_03410 [archaeon]
MHLIVRRAAACWHSWRGLSLLQDARKSTPVEHQLPLYSGSRFFFPSFLTVSLFIFFIQAAFLWMHSAHRATCLCGIFLNVVLRLHIVASLPSSALYLLQSMSFLSYLLARPHTEQAGTPKRAQFEIECRMNCAPYCTWSASNEAEGVHIIVPPPLLVPHGMPPAVEWCGAEAPPRSSCSLQPAASVLSLSTCLLNGVFVRPAMRRPS